MTTQAPAGAAADHDAPAPAPVAGRAGDRLADLAAVGLPTLLSAVLVLHDLGTRSLWVDEGATFSYASQHGTALWRAVTNDGGNMAAYYAGMHVVLELFGTSTVVLRLPSALATIATVPVCFALVRRLFDRRAASLAALFVASSLPLVYWGQMARAYAPCVLALSAATWALVVAQQTRRRVAYVAYAVLAALSISLILLAALAVAAQLASVALRRRGDIALRPLAAAVGAIVVLSVPVALVALAHGSRSLAWIPATGPPLDATNRYLYEFVASAEQGGAPIGGGARLVAWAMTACWALALALFAVCVVRRRRSDETFAWGLLLATFLLPAVVTYLMSELVHPVLNDRYLLPAVAPASMVAGVAVSRLRPAPAAWLCGLVLVGLRVGQIPPTYGVSLENWRSATSYVLAASHPGDCAAFFVADGFPVFDYYLLRSDSRKPRPTPVLPNVSWASRHPFELDPATISPAALPAVVAHCERLWLVETHEGGHRAGPGVPAYQVAKFDAYRVLVTELHPSYVVVDTKAFTGVRVVLFARRPMAVTVGAGRGP